MKPGLTLSEVSKVTGRSVRTVRRWIAEGRLRTQARAQHEPANTPTLIDEKELERFLTLTHRLVHTEDSPAPDVEEVINEACARTRAEFLPLIEELRGDLATARNQLVVFQRELDLLREKAAPVKSASPWRRLLGVD